MTQPVNSLVMPERRALDMRSLEFAASLMPPARHYRVLVGEVQRRYADAIVRMIRQQVEPNPFAPTVSLEVEPTFGGQEWALASNFETVWTPGLGI